MARILIIEDEEQIRIVFREILERSGYEVEVAADGEVGQVDSPLPVRHQTESEVGHVDE